MPDSASGFRGARRRGSPTSIPKCNTGHSRREGASPSAANGRKAGFQASREPQNPAPNGHPCSPETVPRKARQLQTRRSPSRWPLGSKNIVIVSTHAAVLTEPFPKLNPAPRNHRFPSVHFHNSGRNRIHQFLPAMAGDIVPILGLKRRLPRSTEVNGIRAARLELASRRLIGW